MMRQALWVLGVGVLPAILAGCSRETVKLPDTVPYSGKVTLDGKPLSGAAIQFTPGRESKDGYSATGITNAEGKYELNTVIGKHIKPGVTPGSYRVTVSLLASADGKPFDPKATAIPHMKQTLKAEYSDLAATRLVAKVGDKGATQDFDLKSK